MLDLARCVSVGPSITRDTFENSPALWRSSLQRACMMWSYDLKMCNVCNYGVDYFWKKTVISEFSRCPRHPVWCESSSVRDRLLTASFMEEREWDLLTERVSSLLGESLATRVSMYFCSSVPCVVGYTRPCCREGEHRASRDCVVLVYLVVCLTLLASFFLPSSSL